MILVEIILITVSSVFSCVILYLKRKKLYSKCHIQTTEKEIKIRVNKTKFDSMNTELEEIKKMVEILVESGTNYKLPSKSESVSVEIDSV